MSSDAIFELITQHTLEIIPELEGHPFQRSDSLGDLWIAWRGTVCTIPCFGIHRFAPATGVATSADPSWYEGFVFSEQPGSLGRCLAQENSGCTIELQI